MSALYADTSAVVRAYLADEPDHEPLRRLLFGSGELVFTSELTKVEFASAVTTAKLMGRIPDARDYVERFEADTAPGQPFKVIPFAPTMTFSMAERLVLGNHRLRTLDAIHIAVAMRGTAELAGGEAVAFVTRDERQAEVAKANGLEVR